MTKKEKVILEEAIELLLDDGGHFHKAISMLFGLLGKKWHVWEAINDPDFKSVSIQELHKRLKDKPNQPFKFKIKPEWIE